MANSSIQSLPRFCCNHPKLPSPPLISSFVMLAFLILVAMDPSLIWLEVDLDGVNLCNSLFDPSSVPLVAINEGTIFSSSEKSTKPLSTQPLAQSLASRPSILPYRSSRLLSMEYLYSNQRHQTSRTLQSPQTFSALFLVAS